MLSILIPTYNYNTFPLVLELKKQADLLNIDYEIIVQDDAGTSFLDDNFKINELEHCSFSMNEKNLGRTANRTILAKKAKYDLLLFLDSDVLPVKNDFIRIYLENRNEKNYVIFGGNFYSEKQPDKTLILRYKYGKKREQVKADIRNLKPYSNVMSGNMLIDKDIFNNFNFNGKENLYGMDIYFAYQLYINKIKITHIDNPIMHNGLESNIDFFQKSLRSIESRKNHLSNESGIENVNSLLKYYKLIEKLKIKKIICLFFIVSEHFLKNKTLSSNPSLICFDIYRLGYICSLK